ncbi:MAG: site-specific integrase [Actinobacteria bacterium]|nr:site-specific integrase [Actinomycetota bacterium]
MNGSMHSLGNGRYRVRWREPGGKARSRTLDTRTQAKRWLAHVRNGTAVGELPSAAQAVTLGSFLDEWWHAKATQVRPKTAEGYESILRLHVPGAMKASLVRSITTGDIERVLRGIAASGKTVTARNTRAILHQVFQDCVRAGLANLNPVSAARLPREPLRSRLARSERPACPSPREVWNIAYAMPEWARAIVLVGGFAGLRWGEIAGLARDDVDLEQCEIRVERAWSDLTGELGPTKTPASVRTVVFAESIRFELARHLSDHATNQITFPSARGLRLHHSNFMARVWRPMKLSLGVPWRFHDLRHTYASILIDRGVGPAAVARMMGHSSSAVTLRVYVDSWDGVEDRVRSAFAVVPDLGSDVA